MKTQLQQQPLRLLAKGVRLLNADKPTQKIAEVIDAPWGPVNQTVTDDRCEVARQIAASFNACIGLADPAAALTAAREALEALLADYASTLEAYNDYRVHSDGFEAVPEDPSAAAARAALEQLNGGKQP